MNILCQTMKEFALRAKATDEHIDPGIKEV